MKPKSDASQWYKTQKDTTDKAKKKIAEIREILGIKENRYERDNGSAGGGKL